MEHTALIYVMVLTAAADSKMGDAELAMIGEIVRTLPVFDGYDPELLPRTAEDCAEILSGKNGLDTVLKLVTDSLPSRCARPPMRWRAMSPPPIPASARKKPGCCRCCVTAWGSTT